MQYLMGYWGPLPLPSLKGLLGEWCWLLGNAGCCALWVGTLSVCGDPGLDQASFSPQLLAKPNRSQRARELVDAAHAGSWAHGAQRAGKCVWRGQQNEHSAWNTPQWSVFLVLSPFLVAPSGWTTCYSIRKLPRCLLSWTGNFLP